jgi:hypothetical protein
MTGSPLEPSGDVGCLFCGMGGRRASDEPRPSGIRQPADPTLQHTIM